MFFLNDELLAGARRALIDLAVFCLAFTLAAAACGTTGPQQCGAPSVLAVEAR